MAADVEGIDAIDALDMALGALADITRPEETSMRYRDANCVRYVASDVLDQLAERGVFPPRERSAWDRDSRTPDCDCGHGRDRHRPWSGVTEMCADCSCARFEPVAGLSQERAPEDRP